MIGDLVYLSPIAGDVDYELMAQWMSSKASVYAAGTPQMMSTEAAKALLTSVPMNYLMVRTHDGQTVGAVNWSTMAYPGSYTIGCAIGDEKLWGAGYGAESMFLLVEHLFHSLNAHRIHLLAGVFNKPIIEMYASGIVRIEGVLRDYFFVDGEYHDAVVGSILRNEYYGFMSTLGLPKDLIPASEKRDARKILAAYLEKNPIRLAPADE